MKVRVSPYDPAWSIQFEELQSRLLRILAQMDTIVEHIGSTSVPGLAAKPILDIAVGLRSGHELDDSIVPMISHGFLYYAAFNADMPDRRLFVGLKEGAERIHLKSVYDDLDDIPHELINPMRLCHVHVWEAGSDEWKRHLAFREYLRAHPDVCAAYGQLKLELAIHEWEHGMAYNKAKEEFILHHQEKALRWMERNRIGGI